MLHHLYTCIDGFDSLLLSLLCPVCQTYLPLPTLFVVFWQNWFLLSGSPGLQKRRCARKPWNGKDDNLHPTAGIHWRLTVGEPLAQISPALDMILTYPGDAAHPSALWFLLRRHNFRLLEKVKRFPNFFLFTNFFKGIVVVHLLCHPLYSWS